MNGVTELGYIGIEASDVPAWRHFACDVLGLHGEDAGDALALRMDDRAYRMFVEPGPADDLEYAGYDCGDDANLDALIAGLRADGVEVEDCGAALAGVRRVRRLYATRDPVGNRVELYVDLARATTSFQSTLVPAGFCTATGGLGHLFMMAPDYRPMIAFYSRLGFRLSDYIVEEVAPGMVVDAAFMHCNGRHHTAAFAALPVPKRLHHVMIEANSRVDVGRAHDRVQNACIPLELSLGMHPNDHMFSFYVKTPSGFALEFGADGRIIEDDSSWEVVTYDRLSSWGHKPPARPGATLP